MTAGTPAVVAFGANLGDRAATIQAAADDLAATEGVELVTLSPVIETPAVRPYGVDRDAPAYLNTVALIRTELDPGALHAVLRRIEDDHGRTRTERWGDRTLDLDLIAFGELEQDDPELTLPHPRAHERDFVLRPWLAADPHAELPGHGRVDALLAALTGGAS
ncbi:2-amino-4-hydroxy-6-hydroxymethyldihydropteridine diphosphokinase [Protaetiibacter mangrovi]|uniref:2-amino-4-hydroxy-6-hydroxymethyldihydropteridine diphosphokinase n=1 Tax=Protaetiibacter mangrovi TaxID=2970926 RepID=A0ABT1ZCP6_9MICO|nr:2-amino-4-hydroxy-6-hydroxymethyldihydropteridine diphosphokinase [Protaetiibacter mangrovi]MCS0498477.1 2-amino-4-hydroxy-6-hydroxymethyldihydropteridine diphosphokinase [Protaetiibacter mangrovi]TPX02534.1 2-amino-4-hydroxy-6-hydroxymethyldihydropteridine diphosphokinase [Schumannella luteola]